MKSILSNLIIIWILLCPFLCSSKSGSTFSRNEDSLSILNIPIENNRDSCEIFYYTGHHGIIWSRILLDSTGLTLSNGTTRKFMKESIRIPFDTLQLIDNNKNIIFWGFDSLSDQSKQYQPVQDTVYSPLYTELFVIRNGDTIFNLNRVRIFAGMDCDGFNQRLHKLRYLMMWLSEPSSRPYLPIPSDTLQLK